MERWRDAHSSAHLRGWFPSKWPQCRLLASGRKTSWKVTVNFENLQSRYTLMCARRKTRKLSLLLRWNRSAHSLRPLRKPFQSDNSVHPNANLSWVVLIDAASVASTLSLNLVTFYGAPEGHAGGEKKEATWDHKIDRR